MRRPHVRKSSAVTIAAAAALVVTTGGTSAYAAHLITSKQIKNNTIKSIDVHDGSLTGTDVADGSLTGADLAPGTIPLPYGGSFAYSKFNNGPDSVTTNTQLVNLSVPQGGNYVVDATLWARNLASPEAPFFSCTLNAAGDSDFKEVQLRANDGTGGHRAVLALQVVHNFAAAGTVTLTCDGGTNTDASDIKVTAIRVDHLTNTAG